MTDNGTTDDGTTDDGTTTQLTGGIGLLERALSYTLGSLQLITPQAMARPTPCGEWNLRALLRHMADSFTALREAAYTGHIGLDPVPNQPEQGEDPIGALRSRACQLLGAWAGARDPHPISIADGTLTPTVVTGAGAIEIAVHGWDVAQACGQDRPIPSPLVGELLPLSPLFVTDGDRPGRFATAVDVSPQATPSDRLIAFLGRHPAGQG